MTAALSIPQSKSLLHSTEQHWMGTAAGSQWNLLATAMPSTMGRGVLLLHIYWSTQLSHVCIDLVVCFDSALNCAPMQYSIPFHSVWMEAWWYVWHKKSEVYQTCSKLKNVCQVCLLWPWIWASCPVPVRDMALGVNTNDAIAKSDVNCKYFADQQNHKILFLFMSPLISQL